MEQDAARASGASFHPLSLINMKLNTPDIKHHQGHSPTVCEIKYETNSQTYQISQSVRDKELKLVRTLQL